MFESTELMEAGRFFLPRLAFAVLCGGIVGIERELKNKPAGIKTNILICVGSALYTSVSILISESHISEGHYGDPARVAAQIVSGIGFLGGGTIIQSKGTILGLTTAATIWVVAAIGLCVGLGHYSFGLLAAVSVVSILTLSNLFEDKILGRSLSFQCRVTIQDPDGGVRSQIQNAIHRNDLMLDDFDLKTTQGDRMDLVIRYRGHRDHSKKFVLELWSVPGIIEVRSE
jgi:putative Mg2+ transporter-C (MgtC) family protein